MVSFLNVSTSSPMKGFLNELHGQRVDFERVHSAHRVHGAHRAILGVVRHALDEAVGAAVLFGQVHVVVPIAVRRLVLLVGRRAALCGQ